MEAEGAENPNLPVPNIPPQQNNNFTVPAIPLPPNQISFDDFVKKKQQKEECQTAPLPYCQLFICTSERRTN
jgi:hypothetical protein